MKRREVVKREVVKRGVVSIVMAILLPPSSHKGMNVFLLVTDSSVSSR